MACINYNLINWFRFVFKRKQPVKLYIMILSSSVVKCGLFFIGVTLWNRCSFKLHVQCKIIAYRNGRVPQKGLLLSCLHIIIYQKERNSPLLCKNTMSSLIFNLVICSLEPHLFEVQVFNLLHAWCSYTAVGSDQVDVIIIENHAYSAFVLLLMVFFFRLCGTRNAQNFFKGIKAL